MTVSGIVKKHLGRGKHLGYPTANIELSSDILDGVYVGLTEVDNQRHPSIIFVGTPQTFDETDRRLETHLLDFEGDLYDKVITVEIVKKLRENKKFESAQKLIEQMKQDETVARRFFRL